MTRLTAPSLHRPLIADGKSVPVRKPYENRVRNPEFRLRTDFSYRYENSVRSVLSIFIDAFSRDASRWQLRQRRLRGASKTAPTRKDVGFRRIDQ